MTGDEQDLETVIRLNGEELDPSSELGRQIVAILQGGGFEGAELTYDQRRALGSAGKLQIDKRPRRGKAGTLPSALERWGFRSIGPSVEDLLGEDRVRRAWSRAGRRAGLREALGPRVVIAAALEVEVIDDTEEAP